jgi:hypothetical protein
VTRKLSTHVFVEHQRAKIQTKQSSLNEAGIFSATRCLGKAPGDEVLSKREHDTSRSSLRSQQQRLDLHEQRFEH